MAVSTAAPARPTLCIFSKHLAKLDYEQLGKVAKELGFEGVDLTVRPGGHVLPERVVEDLPRACQAIRAYGLEVPMITTSLLRADEPTAGTTLATAARLKIAKFKSGYWRYGAADPEKKIAEVKAATQGLVHLAAQHGVELGFHNHSGDYVGSALWDVREILAGLDPRWAGFYFDPAHATVEGGLFSWQVNLRLASKRLKMVAVKDFFWEKVGGKWRITWCPLGEGMVNWAGVFQTLAQARFTGPISLHIEYEARDELAAIARDLDFLRSQVKKAYAV